MSEESEMQNDDENIQAKNDIDSNNNKDDEKLPVNDTLTLVLDLVEVSREEYITKYGQESLIEDPVSAAASRIGKVVLNEEALKDGVLKTGSRLLFKSFDGNSYIILIESVLKGDLTSYAGSIIDPQQGFFSLSASNNKALMSIEMPGKNTMYLIKYNHVSGLHYLFKAPMDKVDFLPD